MSISVLCFSKDRPLQLEAYLRSLFRFSRETLPVTVLYACEKRFDPAYAKLRSFFPSVDFVRETDFRDQVLGCLRQIDTPLFMFGCDDVIFKRAWQPKEIWRVFQVLPELLAFSLRLGTEITYCQPLGANMSEPDFLEVTPFLLWRWPLGDADWGYPWELDCTIYTTQFVRRMLLALERFGWAHPNLLEGHGANLIGSTIGLDLLAQDPYIRESALARIAKTILVAMGRRPLNRLEDISLFSELNRFLRGMVVRQIGGRDLMASYAQARASVITINRVQDVSRNPVYEGDLTAEVLLDKWNGGTVLDTDAYAERSYSSIHVGEAYFCKRSEQTLRMYGSAQ